MKLLSLISTVLASFIFLPSQATAAVFSKAYAFGDSLSDNGNTNDLVLAATGGQNTFPPSPPYFQGRFSNGKAWIEILADKLGIELVNSAFGGVTSGTQNTLDTTLPGFPLPGLQQQIARFVVSNPVADSEALYTLWIGANDYLPTDSIGFTPSDTPNTSLNNIQLAVNSLVGVGAKNIMVVNLPNLGEVPKTRATLDGNCPLNNQFDADCLNALTKAHNTGLSGLFSFLSPDVTIIPLDVNTLVNNTIANPAKFGLTNVTDACLDLTTFISCGNPDEYLFWDNQHPSRTGNRLIGQYAFRALGIPEPSAIAGLVLVGIMVVGTAFRKTNS